MLAVSPTPTNQPTFHLFVHCVLQFNCSPDTNYLELAHTAQVKGSVPHDFPV